jgi:hypothetical protein
MVKTQNKTTISISAQTLKLLNKKKHELELTSIEKTIKFLLDNHDATKKGGDETKVPKHDEPSEVVISLPDHAVLPETSPRHSDQSESSVLP